MCVQAAWCEAALVQSEAECVWFEASHPLSSVVLDVWLETLSVWTEVPGVVVTEVAHILSLLPGRGDCQVLGS